MALAEDTESTGEGLYPMRVVERLTGLPADTIRAWEKRYGVVSPSRTDGRARRYSESEVRRLVLLREATEQGHSIRSIGALPDATLTDLVRRPVRPESGRFDSDVPPLDEVRSYLALVERFETRRALEAITRTSAVFDPRTFCLAFLQPMLEEIGRRWEHGSASVIHEHIVSTHVKMVLGMFSRLAPAGPGDVRVAFLTPEGHAHEFGIHIGAILATMRGIEPIVLGPNVPHVLLDDFVRGAVPDALVFGVSRDATDDEITAMNTLCTRLASETDVWIGCARTNPLFGTSAGATFLEDFEALDEALLAIASRPRKAARLRPV